MNMIQKMILIIVIVVDDVVSIVNIEVGDMMEP